MHFNDEYIDFHCHPSLKPFGKSFNYTPTGIHISHRNSKRSIWHYNPPSIFDKLLNYATGLYQIFPGKLYKPCQGRGGYCMCLALPIRKMVREKQNEQ